MSKTIFMDRQFLKMLEAGDRVFEESIHENTCFIPGRRLKIVDEDKTKKAIVRVDSVETRYNCLGSRIIELVLEKMDDTYKSKVLKFVRGTSIRTSQQG